MFDLNKAKRTQENLASLLKFDFPLSNPRTVGAVDCGYERGGRRLGAVIVVFDLNSGELLEEVRSLAKIFIPYIPGFLNFREAPVIIKAWRQLRIKPDVLLVDGNGIAHPRKMGLASYLGVLLDQPTIGCAKSPFFPYQAPERERGGKVPYYNQNGEQVGLCLRTRDGVKPVFVSPGHKMDIQTAGEIVLNLAKFRLPEPLRIAHQKAQGIFKH